MQTPWRRSTARSALGLALSLLVVVPQAPVGAIQGRDAGTLAGHAAPPAATLTDATPGSSADPADGPSIQYLESVAHAGDRIDFQPGARVSVPFRPRATDRWSVGGAAPRPLPAGRLTGAEMRDAQGPPAPADDPAASPDTTNADSAVLTAPVAGQTVAAVGDGGLRREVLGFLPYWEVGDSSTVLDYSTLSTVAYFSVGCASGGTLLKKNSDGSTTTGWGGWTGSRMSSVITAAHQAGTRVVMTLTCFAWSDGGAKLQASILNSSTYRTALAKAVAGAVRDRGADGVNLDFEPLVSGTEAGFTAFVRALRSAFSAYAPGYEITFDTMGRMGNYPIVDATAPGGADALMIMGYDYRTASSSSAGSISPLTGPPYDLHDTLSAYSAKVSPSKLLLGIPYYGRAWSTSSNGPHAANISGTKYGSSVTSTYANAVSLAAQYGRKWDAIEGAPWTAYQKQTCTTTYGCVTSWRELYYDDATSLGMRYDLVNRAGIRGAGIWALGYDGTRPELRQALADKFLHDTTPPVTGVATLGASQRDEGFAVTWKAYDDSAVAGYDVQVSTDGGAWATWLTGSTHTSDVFLGTDGHTYAFRARGTDAAGNTSAWFDVPLTGLAVPATLAGGGFGTVVTDGLRMRSNATTGGTVMTTLSKGDAVSIIGGPRTGEGYTWYQVVGPVRQWGTVDYAQIGGWVAASGNGSTNLAPRAAVYATRVSAGLRGYAVGAGGDRLVTPNGDGVNDSIRVAWTNALALDALTLRIFGADGSLVGTKALAKLGAGAQTFDWNGTFNGAPVAAGNYVLQLVGTKGTTTYTAPSASPVTPLQLTTFGIAVAPDPPTSVYAFAATTASPTRATTITFSLVFGGLVTGLTSADLTRSGTATGCVVGPPVGSGASYTVTVTSCSGGSLVLGLKANSVTDGVANTGPEVAALAPTVVIDRSAPTTTTPTMGVTAGGTYNGSPVAGRVGWAGADTGGAGVASYDVERSVDGGAFSVVAAGLTSPAWATGVALGHTYRYAVRARDKAGNVGGWKAGPTTSPAVREDVSTSLVYGSGWHKAWWSQFSGGTAHYATAAGATVRYTFTGRSIAVVSTLAATRGAVKVYLDGAYVTTIDTYAATTAFRRIIWSRTFGASGTHTIRLVVVGTAGRPRVDLDAFLVLR